MYMNCREYVLNQLIGAWWYLSSPVISVIIVSAKGHYMRNVFIA